MSGPAETGACAATSRSRSRSTVDSTSIRLCAPSTRGARTSTAARVASVCASWTDTPWRLASRKACR
ncbi:hypothetical protein [Lysobacter gummosus]|uniref:hypothetical protein n=1 Tax=Lysobacter gummosus TaxID=262324 RepID=UPI00363D0984